jgi:hypothetical protein
MKPHFEHPPVHISKSGVSSVSAADILRSAAGQREIYKTLSSGIYRPQRRAGRAAPNR